MAASCDGASGHKARSSSTATVARENQSAISRSVAGENVSRSHGYGQFGFYWK